jgi:hypothetical protein
LRCPRQRDAKAKAVAMAKGRRPGKQRLCCAPDNRCPGCDGCLCGRRVLASAGEAAGGSAPAASSVPMADGHQRRALACAWAEYRSGQWWLLRSTGTVLPCRPERSSHLPHSASPGNSRRPTIFSLRPEQRWRGALRHGDTETRVEQVVFVGRGHRVTLSCQVW